jgi:transcriptional regulator with XRE-family HTH domain
MTPKQIGQYLKKRREERGLSRQELAERARISREYVRRLEAGWQDPTIGTLQRLAKALEVNMDITMIDPIEKLRRLKTVEVLREAALGGRSGAWFEGALPDRDFDRGSATEALAKSRLIAKTKDGRTYRATDRGHEFLRRHRLEGPEWISRAGMINFP